MDSVVEIPANSFDREVRESDNPVVVEFWMRSCPNCQKFKPVYDKLPKFFSGEIKFVKMNMLLSLENLRLAEGFGVDGTPTLKLYCDGVEVGEIIGYRPLDKVVKEIYEVFEQKEQCRKYIKELKNIPNIKNLGKTLIFVYNVDRGLLKSFKYTLQKTFSSNTDQCRLYALTSNPSMKSAWKKFIDSLGIPTKFLHKDQFLNQYDFKGAKFPSVYLKTENDIQLYIPQDEINSLKSLEELKDLVKIKLKKMSD